MKAPTFFIVGAPKCGTTALSEYLRTHPNVFISNPKEPCYFSDDFPGQCYINSMEEYMGLFQNASKEHLAIGEGSVWYLYSSVAFRNIYRFNKNSKIIVMLRNPVDLVYSLHSELFHLGYEKEKNFAKAWRLQEVRQNGHNIPRYCKEKKFLQYAQIGKLGNQIERLLNIFPKKQIKFIIFDDFKTNTKKVYDDVLSFLEVPSDNKSNFLPKLENRRHKITWLGALFENNPTLINDLKMRFKKFTGID
ncbi:MAG: sulfotransferase domain-containing protein, partial [Planctomycetes bacterium]|nr:sulfotransferase domain-containing protein [Planctomycetota bacterium]